MTTSSANYVGYAAGTLNSSYNDWYNMGSGGSLTGGSAGTGSVSTDPGFEDLTDDGSYSNDDWTLSSSSSCIDAGSSSSSYTDADGTRADMGAYGGPESEWED